MKNPLPRIHRVIVPMSGAYMEYEQLVSSDRTSQAILAPSHYCRTVDYSNVVDACLEDLPESKYL